MKNMVVLIFVLCISQSLTKDNACFSSTNNSPSKASDCENRDTGNKKSQCCFVEFTTNRNFQTYSKLCVDVLKTDIEDGMFEEVMKTIERAEYSGTEWDETQQGKFKDYASIKNFDCKSNYLTVSFLLFVFLML